MVHSLESNVTITTENGITGYCRLDEAFESLETTARSGRMKADEQGYNSIYSRLKEEKKHKKYDEQ